jgi:DNA-binding response OmpR family regulator
MAESDIMIVDDNPANLKLLEDMLQQRGYEVRSFPLGRLALASAKTNPPDLILLDISMPEMNGYQVCERLKSDQALSDIPVIFLSALNGAEDKVQAFRSGGVDYVSKPFQFEEVQARVQTHVKLRRAQQSERALLEKTLGGAIATLWELVQLTSPALALRSHSIRDIVLRIAKRIAIGVPWQYEHAATLCLLGCISLPDEVFEKAYCGQDLSPDEERMFRAHPETAARLLSKIPRLEIVSEIIRGQQSPQANPGSEVSVTGGDRITPFSNRTGPETLPGRHATLCNRRAQALLPVQGLPAGCAGRLFSRTGRIRTPKASDSRTAERHDSGARCLEHG